MFAGALQPVALDTLFAKQICHQVFDARLASGAGTKETDVPTPGAS